MENYYINYDSDLWRIIPDINGYLEPYGLYFEDVSPEGGDWLEYELIVSDDLKKFLEQRNVA